MNSAAKQGQVVPGGADPYPTDPFSELPHLNDTSSSSSPSSPATIPDLHDKGTYPKTYSFGGHCPILELVHRADNGAPNVGPVSRAVPHSAIHPAVPTQVLRDRVGKIISNVDDRLSQVELANEAFLTLAGFQAFHHYNWLTRVSAPGDLRCVVVSPKWYAAFRFFVRTGEYVGNIGLVAGFAAGIAEAGPELVKLRSSGAPELLTGARMTAIAGTAAQRALLGIVPAGAHLIYMSLQRACMMAGQAGGKIEIGANQCVATLKYADTLVLSTFNAVTDTANQAKVITYTAGAVTQGAKEVWLVIDTVLAPRSGK